MRRFVLLFAVLSAALPLRAQDSTIRLWLRGDDFGYTHASNVAMEAAFNKGHMTSASVLVPGPWFAETAAMAVVNPDWSIGIHLTITSEWNVLRWRPVSPIGEVPSLVAPDGYLWGSGYRPGRGDPELTSPRANHFPEPAEVEKEFRAQIERAKAMGVRVEYVDCHMGIACRESLLPITRKLAAENCIPIGGGQSFPELGRVRIDWDERTWEEGRRLLSDELRKLRPGLWMYVAHPAADSPELRSVDTVTGDRWARQRSAVTALWSDPGIRALIDELGIELVGPRDLFDYDACEPK